MSCFSWLDNIETEIMILKNITVQENLLGWIICLPNQREQFEVYQISSLDLSCFALHKVLIDNMISLLCSFIKT